METTACGKAWESVVGDLRLRRTVESADGDRLLVRMTFENEGSGRLATRVVEDVPDDATDLSVVTTAAGDPRTFSHVGDWTVHELTIPGGKRRTSAYLLEIDDESPAFTTPRIRHVAPVDDRQDDEAPPTITDSTGDRGVIATTSAADAERAGEEREPSVRTARTDGASVDDDGVDPVKREGTRTDRTGTVDARESNDRDVAGAEPPEPEVPTASEPVGDVSVLDELLAELSAEPDGERRAELRAKLGVSPADEARFRHLQSRLDDLAAYVDALETLVDDHGIDAIDAMDDRIANNADRTAELGEELSDLAERGTRLGDRLADVEETLAALESDVRELATARETDRQVHARDVRRVERSLADLDATVDGLESDVDEFEAFQQRFRAAFASDQRPGARSPTEHEDATDGDREQATDDAAGRTQEGSDEAIQ